MTPATTSRCLRLVWIALVAVSAVAVAGRTATAGRQVKPPSEADVKKVTEALPEAATAKPARPHKVLVFWRCEGFFHGCIPLANKALELLGEKTGAYRATVSADYAMFDPDKLKEFDAVILNNTTRVKLSDEQRKALLDFVAGGKGLVGIHAASDNFYDWPEGQEMIGGLFHGHPWGGGGTWAVKLDDPEHVLNKAFDGQGFLIRDEIYRMKTPPYSRENVRVLLSLDMSKERNRRVKGSRQDNDNAIAWIRTLGSGRIFYCSLGHHNEIFWNEAVLRHYLDGIQYALGDLKADATPSAKLSPQPEPALCPED